MGNTNQGTSKADDPESREGVTNTNGADNRTGERTDSQSRQNPLPQPVTYYEPDERTRLLPASTHHGISGQPPLDIDDPAVTPLNLWGIRFLRYITIAFLLVASGWWLVLLVTTFVSPQGFHSRGGGWFAFGYTSLAIGILMLLLFSFTVPSRAEEVIQSVIAVLLLVNLIVTLSVPGLREEEGWIGIASAIFVLFVTLWAVCVDRSVEWGKKEEEERLTGRAETRRSLKEWCSVFSALVIMVIFLVISILLTGTLSLRAYDQSLEVPGKRVWVEDRYYRVHIFCTPEHSDKGREKVTVFLESGERAVANGLLDWAQENYVNGTIGRFCYWDRPGYAFSDVAPSPLSAGMAADALSEALAKVGEKGPFILVAHGIGSIYTRIFASRQGKSIKGLMLIDPLHESYLPDVGSTGRGFFMWFRGVISPLGLEILFDAIFKARSREDRIFGKSSYLNAKTIKAKLQESLAAKTFTKPEVSTSKVILNRKIPLVVVSSGEGVKKDSRWDQAQKESTELTDSLLHWDIVNKAGHKVWETADGWDMMSKRIGKLVDIATEGNKFPN
ncbi:hypothetical protein TWF569_003938 [Orbilia oligospora]|uniref:AB hydrolase-1 domain-containing protein n=1 Tax=Orbilia oligospora TaxID=2813651 RepID=A0A7C8ND70_ORBOL|nr:hypothetical protein TWF102_005359 [Orbilia oligospora]KAF3107728.1 hypothetical protein TWF706_002557 [Orbilia oligospora]KAF3114135.1 hypothetical protein TWF103_001559 [Orbilia oligospora]KAF3136572.1 hypothetical protein TWF594_007837 [Orbilia oligospora]KAF3147210.1 hypothetical protein TWF703_000050 [Orbilia oligospora]